MHFDETRTESFAKQIKVANNASALDGSQMLEGGVV